MLSSQMEYWLSGRSKSRNREKPIVMAVVGGPLETAWVGELGANEENLTGLSILAPELSGKRLELLKEVVPKSPVSQVC